MPNAANATRPMGELLADAQAAANILGRLTILRDASHKTTRPLQFNASSRLQTFADSDGDSIKVYTSFDLPNDRAVEYLRTLTPVTREVFDGLSKQYKAEAFTITGVTDQRILQRVRDRLAAVIQAGGTTEDFNRELDHLASAEGIEQLAAVDVDGVFQGLSQKAYSAGRYEQMTDSSVMDALPYWQFWTVGDDRVRPEHRVLDHFTARSIDPVWMKIYPPCGYGCRCSVVPITADDAPEGSDDGGLERLPALAELKVPQPGFQTIFGGI